MTVYRFFILICGIVFFLNTTNAREKETVSTLSIAELVLQKALDNINLGLYPGSLLMHGMSEMTLIHPEKEVMLKRTLDLFRKYVTKEIVVRGNFISYEAGGSGAAMLYYLKEADVLRAQVEDGAIRMMKDQNRSTEGIMIPPRMEENRIFIDVAFAVTPYLLYAGMAFNRQDYIDLAVYHVIELFRILEDKETGLLHQERGKHGFNVFSQDNWSRGNGWGAFALSILVRDLPMDHPQRQEVDLLAKKFFTAVLKHQSKNGLWHQEMSDKSSYTETSGSGMLLFGLGIMIEKGLFGKRYEKNLIKGLRGYLAYIGCDGSVSHTCKGCLSPGKGTKEDYINHEWVFNDHHAFGPAVLAFTQAAKMGIKQIKPLKNEGCHAIMNPVPGKPGTYVRFVPERREDLAWENDRIAFRVSVDATRVNGKLDPFWASQIIHPTEFMMTEWGENLISLFKESGAAQQYIRMYNQPEMAIRVSPDGKISYDWSRFEGMADLILSKGLKPKVMFFGMPAELAAFPDTVRVRPYGGIVGKSKPADYKQWEELCADFTRHVVRKYGINEVKQWTFRCWNEPNGRSFWYTGMSDQDLHLKEYLKLYDHFANGVKKVHPDIRVGGPALTNTGTFNRPEIFRMVLEHFANGINFATGKTGSPLDFISVHVYGTTMNYINAENNPEQYAPSVDYMVNHLTLLADIRDQFPGLREIPIHLEEWGICGGGTTGIIEKPHADIRNSEYGSAFLVALVQRFISMKIENDRKIEAFTFCASGYERIPEHDFMGYRTFHTKSGFHKPLLNGYSLLNRLASDIVPVTTGNGNKHVTAFATRNKDKITIVVVNFQNDRIFNDGPSYPVELNIKSNWNPGTKLTMNHWRIDKDHSNAYTAFKEIGSPELPNPLQIDEVKKRMDMELLGSPKQMKAADMVNITFELPCNGVSLIEIVKD